MQCRKPKVGLSELAVFIGGIEVDSARWSRELHALAALAPRWGTRVAPRQLIFAANAVLPATYR